jgi:hypothetical protein
VRPDEGERSIPNRTKEFPSGWRTSCPQKTICCPNPRAASLNQIEWGARVISMRTRCTDANILQLIKKTLEKKDEITEEPVWEGEKGVAGRLRNDLNVSVLCKRCRWRVVASER